MKGIPESKSLAAEFILGMSTESLGYTQHQSGNFAEPEEDLWVQGP